MNLHHPTTHKRLAFKVPPLPAANDTATTDTTGAFVTIPTSEYAALIRQLEAVKTILTAPDETWTPTHRAIAAALYLEREPIGNVIPSAHDANTLAAMFHVSTGTARAALKQMAAANAIEYKKMSTPVNRYGEVLEHGAKMDMSRGDTWRNSVTLTLPAQPVIRPLGQTPTKEKDRAIKQQQRDELRRLQAKLAALECPECGTVGHLQITCGECGCKLDTPPDKSDSDLSVIDKSESDLCPPDKSDSDLSVIDKSESDLCPPDKSESDLSVIDKSESDLCPPDKSDSDLSVIDK
jgi:hypothetical protein